MKNILLLFLLVVITVLAYFFMVYFRGKRATHFGNIKTLERVHGFDRFHMSPMILLVKIIIISFLFLAATQAVEILKETPISDIDYVVLLDASPSMAKTDYSPNRLAAAKEISINWLNLLSDDTRVGFVVFTRDIMDFVPLTLDKEKVIQHISAVEIDYSKSGTSLDFALSYAFELFEEDSIRKTVLLLTDGTEEVSKDTIAVANSRDIRIYAFGIGGNETYVNLDEIPEEFREDYARLDFNFTKLEKIATETDGEAFQVANNDELRNAFRQATLKKLNIPLNSGYYVLLLIALLSIAELLIYSKFGAL